MIPILKGIWRKGNFWQKKLDLATVCIWEDGEVLITSPALLFPSDDRRRRLPELTGDRITSVVKKKALLTSRGERIEHKAAAVPVAKKEQIKRAFGFTQGISAWCPTTICNVGGISDWSPCFYLSWGLSLAPILLNKFVGTKVQ